MFSLDAAWVTFRCFNSASSVSSKPMSKSDSRFVNGTSNQQGDLETAGAIQSVAISSTVPETEGHAAPVNPAMASKFLSRPVGLLR